MVIHQWTAGLAVGLGSCGAIAGPPTVEEVLAKARAATGQASVDDHAAGLSVSASASFLGNDVRCTLLYDAAGHYVQRFDGPIPYAAGFDGERAWAEDLAGETRILLLGERSEAIIAGAAVTGSWLMPGAPFSFTVDAAATDDVRVTLAFDHTGGFEEGSIEIDRATWRPTRWSYDNGGARVTIALEGVHEFGGVRLPDRMTQTTDNGLSIVLDIDAIAEAPLFIRSPYEPVLGAPAGVEFDATAPAGLEVVKAPTGHLLVHPLVGGRDLGWFIFDTGAGSSVLSTPVMEDLGLKPIGRVPATGVGGSVEAPFCRPGTIALGPVTMHDPLMVAIDLSFLSGHMGRPIAGVIGYDLIVRCVAEVDMVEGKVSLHDPAAFDASGLNWHTLVVADRVPAVEARFEGHEGLFKLDTGAGRSTVMFHRPAVERLGLLEGRETEESAAGGVGGTVQARRGKLDWFEVAGRRIEDVQASFAVEAKGAFRDPYTAGNMGCGLLDPFVLVFDYQKGRIAYRER